MTNDTLKLEERIDGQQKRGYLFDYLYVLVKWRKFIVTTILGVGILSAALSLLLPNWYAATASVLPPKRPGGLLSFWKEGDFHRLSKICQESPGRQKLQQTQMHSKSYELQPMKLSKEEIRSLNVEIRSSCQPGDVPRSVNTLP